MKESSRLSILIAILFWIFFISSSALCFCIALLIWLLTSWWDRRLVVLHQFTSFWAHMYIWVMPAWSVRISGREKLVDQPMVMVSNHQSLLDILVAFGIFFPFKWVSKAEIFKAPFIGWNMRLNRYIQIVRGDKESGRKMLADCEQALQQGSAVYLFPEGTRSQTGLLRDFKPGAFILAHQAKVPIQPLVINGTKNALPKHSIGFHGHHPIDLRILEPIPYQAFAELSVEETAQMVRELILEHVKEHQQQTETVSASSESA